MQALPFHAGELELHRICALPRTEAPDNPTLPGTSLSRYATWLRRVPLVAVGTLDAQGQPWTALWSGESGMLQARGQALAMRVRLGAAFPTKIDSRARGETETEWEQRFMGPWDWAADPVAASFHNMDGAPSTASPRMVSLLAVNLEERNRVKLFGTLTHSCANDEYDEDGDAGDDKVKDVMLVVKIEQALGTSVFLAKPSVATCQLTGQEIAPNICTNEDWYLASPPLSWRAGELNYQQPHSTLLRRQICSSSLVR